ncbi:hypothetical protein Kpol_1067p18 [Vanderwaltozyma polyspora DSM 70294]|uniref:Mitochondrial distribution and morphology protein 31 n=1 Tax=Vanderwaltozyma polyspora (strain ATCC 22028 / DSM 70294 / BCRC 21397 / CBS 2163 / NBRC 10782 / NRRL Y-8283 / UCD 57-17) TaxID=436907 RepID=A7TNW3_VANPO|nr:uncharacterized protein Kpol_1067p18 [Vanderwaltozyma polyspora DSM 70294]EDO16046.1 hypothetical protein Kpol_1067p18 [Vanderwaltozyma polyspora DSM 70294]
MRLIHGSTFRSISSRVNCGNATRWLLFNGSNSVGRASVVCRTRYGGFSLQRQQERYKYDEPKKPSKVTSSVSNKVNKFDFKYITEKDRLIAQSKSNFEKLRINMRWFLTKSTTPLNKYYIFLTTFISWLFVSNLFLILFGTTTFVSIILFLLNTVSAQEFLTTKIGYYITKNTSLYVVFENAMVPNWASGNIIMHKVFISRRPKLSQNFTKGSQEEAVQRAELALREKQFLINDLKFDDGNYTQFDLTIDQLEFSLSLSNWLNGKGIVDEVKINGLRGVVDRTHVAWKPKDNPRNYLNVHKPGDFEINKFSMNDVLITLYQPRKFRPFQVSIHNCELPQLRKNWLFFDILNATSMSGTYDNSMFTIHKKLLKENEEQHDDNNLHFHKKENIWQAKTRLRVDNLDVDHLNAGIDGPFGWITEGQVDMIGDILLPNNDIDPIQILTEISERLLIKAKDYSLLFPMINNLNDNSNLIEKPKEEPKGLDPNNYFIMDFFLKLHNVKAEVPLFTQELSYMNNAIIRPIVGYINSNRTYIPIKCRIVKDIADFDGSWTMYDSLLMNDLSAQVYDAFAEYVADERRRSVRLRRVGFWSLQLILQLILMSLGAIA